MSILVDPSTKTTLVDSGTQKVLVDNGFACDGCTEVTYDLTYTIGGTCSSGIEISTTVEGHSAGTTKFQYESSLGTATYCNGASPAEIDNGNGQMLATCGDSTKIINMFLSTLLVKVLTSGDIEGIPFVAGDWALLIGSQSSDIGALGDCEGCSGTFISPTVIQVFPGVPNVHTVSAGGITYTITLNFTSAHTGCDPNPCSDVTLSCDQISAGMLKCGYTCLTSPFAYCEGDCPHGYYLVAAQTYHHGTPDPLPYATYCAACDWCSTGFPTSIEYTLNEDDGSCTGIVNVGCTTITYVNCDSCDGVTPPSCCNADPSCTDTFTCPGDPPPVHSCCAGTQVTNIDSSCATFSSEYTTAMLVAFTEAAMPVYDDDFNDDCEAFTLLESFDVDNMDEDSYTVARFKPKFTIPGALDHDLVICYNEYGGGVYTPRIVTIPTGSTFVIGDEVVNTNNKQTTTISDIKCCP